MKIFTALLSTSTLLLLCLFPQALATPPGGHLNIEEVVVTIGDPDTTLEIKGWDFDFGSPLEVTLAGMPAAVISATGVTITATVSTSLFPDGDYLLTVSTGNGQSQNDEYDLTIGAVGAQGEQGIQGEQGPQGIPGLPGSNGADGSSCSVAKVGDTATISCEDGTVADVSDGAEGPEGPPGQKGDKGDQGPPGLLSGETYILKNSDTILAGQTLKTVFCDAGDLLIGGRIGPAADPVQVGFEKFVGRMGYHANVANVQHDGTALQLAALCLDTQPGDPVRDTSDAETEVSCGRFGTGIKIERCNF